MEGVVKSLFSKLKVESDLLKPQIDELQDYLKNWEGFGDEETALFKRIDGFLRSLTNASIESKLYAIAKRKAVDEAFIPAWSEVRNKYLHGGLLRPEELETLAKLCDKMTVLLHQLVFHKIGFRGVYIDYSLPGWPGRRYPEGPITDQEIATVAYFLWEKEGRPQGKEVAHWIAARNAVEQGIA